MINPKLKLTLELGPVVLFFLGFRFFKDRVFHIAGTEYSGFIVMTAVFIALIMAATALLWWLTGKLSKMQLVTLVLVVVMGSATIWFNDERFFKMKPTMIYLVFAGILGFGLMRGKSYLSVVMDEALPLQPEGWMILTRRITLFFVGLAVANEAIWRSFSTETWVNFKTFGLTAALFAFFLTQARVFERYAVPQEKSGD